MTKTTQPYEKKFFVPKDFLLSPEAAPIRAVAESMYPFYLRAAFKAGHNVETNHLPVLDDNFMNSHQARWVRILAETTYAQITMKQLKVHNTVVFFGSAQIPEPEVAKQRLQKAVSSGDKKAVARARKVVGFSVYYEQARELSARLTRWSLESGNVENPQPFVVCTGGGPSMMEAGNRGAQDAGGKSVGLNITLPHEQMPNPYIAPDLNFIFHYFFTRKFHFIYRAKALVVFPGGYGSLDELFEVLNLIKCEKIIKNIAVILYGSRFWKQVIDFDFMLESGVINEADLEMLSYADTVETAFEMLKAHLTSYLKK
jgi:uncharacterized protein (TIGR00730 family)